MEQRIESLLYSLNETPRLLKELLSEIPSDLHTKRIIPGKCSIHEHATHISEGDVNGFQKRLKQFHTEEHPIIEPLSGNNFSENYFLDLNLQQSIVLFFERRKETLRMAYALDEKQWDKEGTQPEYKRYTPYIMLRHLLMHDHTHLYQIEELGCGTLH